METNGRLDNLLNNVDIFNPPPFEVTAPVSSTALTQPLPRFTEYACPITNTKPRSDINIPQLHKLITHPARNFVSIGKLRKSTEADQKIYKRTQLDYFTPSGTFEKRDAKSLKTHSGYLVIDFDGLTPDAIKDFRTKLIADKIINTVLLFLSPTATGLKWIIPIPANAETHEAYFDAVKNYIETTYQVEVDKSGRDVARACFYSHDPEAYLGDVVNGRPLDKAFLLNWTPQKKKKPATKPAPVKPLPTSIPLDDESSRKLEQVNRLAALVLEKRIDLTMPYCNWVKVGHALCELGENGRDSFHHLSSLHAGYNFDTCDEKYTALLDSWDGSIKLGTLFYMAKEHGMIISGASTTPPTLKGTAQQAIISSSRPRTATQRLIDAGNQPDITPLVGAVWQSGELHVLFGDTGCGKSVLAVQIAESLSKGKSLFPVTPNEFSPQRVLFYDFELSDRQFRKRYSCDKGLHYFTDNFFIDNINFQQLVNDNPNMKVDELVIQKIKADIKTIKPDVVIIDNLTYLKTESVQETGVALTLIRELNNLKREFNISMLVLAHTPKLKDGIQLSVNELGGSKHLSNFCDSVSAIGKSSQGGSIRYLKQVKVRSGELIFDASSVIAMEMKHEEGFLGFHYIDCENEFEHLLIASNEQRVQEKMEKKARAMELHKEGKSFREIETLIGISKSTISVWLK